MNTLVLFFLPLLPEHVGLLVSPSLPMQSLPLLHTLTDFQSLTLGLVNFQNEELYNREGDRGKERERGRGEERERGGGEEGEGEGERERGRMRGEGEGGGKRGGRDSSY